MTKSTWIYVAIAVLVAVAANSLSAIWASKDNKFTIWLLLLIIISPIVFITFGLVTAKVGLAISSATIDSILTVTSVLVGLFLFGGFSTMLPVQWVGLLLTISGILLLHLK